MAYGKAFRLNSTLFIMYSTEGQMLNDLDQKEEALAAYEQAILLAPREAKFYYYKGYLLELLGRLAEAKRAYEEAERLGYNS